MSRITPDMIAAFENGDVDVLDALLGIRPWELSPLDVVGDDECVYSPGTAGAKSWPKARRLLKELEKAARGRGR